MTKEVRSPVTELDPSKFRTMPLVIAMQENSIKLLVEAMHEVGPAAQTLGGILRLTLRCTFASQSKISIASGLPLKTVRKHLLTLQEHSFIHNNGREPTQSGRARRTCTIRSTGRTLEVVKNYCPLPWWTAATSVGNQWCSRALRAVVVRRWLELRAGIITTYRGEPFHEHELPDRLNSIGGEDRFGFSLPKFQKMTGLDGGIGKMTLKVRRRLPSTRIDDEFEAIGANVCWPVGVSSWNEPLLTVTKLVP